MRLLPALPLLTLAGCAPGVLDPAGPVAAGEKTLLYNSLAGGSIYTDAGNATANHVYESIGYQWVADSMSHGFVPDPDEES